MKQLKAFIPFMLPNDTFFKWLTVGANMKNVETFHDKAEYACLVTRDPEGSEWGTLGLTSFQGDRSLSHDLDGAACMLLYQFNDRVLPGTVRDEKVVERVKEMQERGEKIHKKMYAEIRDSVEASLLPDAFIRRSLVPVLVFKDMLLICTTSPKKCDDIMVQLFKLANLMSTDKFAPESVRTVQSPAFMMRELATNGDAWSEDAGVQLRTMSAMKLRGPEKRVISIKDRDVLSADVQKLMEDASYEVAELACIIAGVDDEEDMATFMLTDRGFVKAIKLTDSFSTRADKDDAHVSAWLLATTLRDIAVNLIEIMGGIDVGNPTLAEIEDEEI